MLVCQEAKRLVLSTATTIIVISCEMDNDRSATELARAVAAKPRPWLIDLDEATFGNGHMKALVIANTFEAIQIQLETASKSRDNKVGRVSATFSSI